MENDREQENLIIISDVIEEPLMIFHGEGSGKECNVGNDEKSNIFFFGQPGCLKHSPIKTFSTESITSLNSFKSSSSSTETKVDIKEKSNDSLENSTKSNNNEEESSISSTQNDKKEISETIEKVQDESNKKSNENDLKSKFYHFSSLKSNFN
jgi:hypothetical protein